MTQLPIPARAEGPCPRPECTSTLKAAPDELTINGPLATVRLVCGQLHQVDFQWKWNDEA